MQAAERQSAEWTVINRAGSMLRSPIRLGAQETARTGSTQSGRDRPSTARASSSALATEGDTGAGAARRCNCSSLRDPMGGLGPIDDPTNPQASVNHDREILVAFRGGPAEGAPAGPAGLCANVSQCVGSTWNNPSGVIPLAVRWTGRLSSRATTTEPQRCGQGAERTSGLGGGGSVYLAYRRLEPSVLDPRVCHSVALRFLELPVFDPLTHEPL